ncbi:MAG: glycine--tRNA ligase [Firmicutes bacterium]|nr:glycine--tRNA ligase [Bacillota bacterium]
MSKITMEKLVGLCKTRGFVYPGSDIYGGLANSWDYGPLGVELKNNIKKIWWNKFIRETPSNVGMDSGILMNPETWVASGHVGGFTDPLLDCRVCKSRFRADKLIEERAHKQDLDVNADGWDIEEMQAYIAKERILCPRCGSFDYTEIRHFNLMFKTHQGATEDSSALVYLRPETAQGIFVNFKNVLISSRRRPPFGIGQIGKAFRNEITPGNFVFRTREFEQMELEFFVKPSDDENSGDMYWYDYWCQFVYDFLLSLGVKEENLRRRQHSEDELSHYAKATTDIEYLFPFGWGELWGIAHRTDFDLRVHQEHAGVDLSVLDPQTNEKYLPYCIEPSVSVERLALMFLLEAYDEEVLENNETRALLRFHPALAPIKAAILPLSKKLSEPAKEIYSMLAKKMQVEYDEAGSIGRRYRRWDEAGAPFCITVDFQTAEDNCVTVRYRDTMEQDRILISELTEYLEKQLEF